MWASISAQIRIGEPTPEVLNYCKKELTLANPDCAKKERMGFWTGDTPKTIYLYEKDGKEIVLPFGCYDDVVPYASDIFTAFGPEKKVSYDSSVELYDYQREAVDRMLKAGRGILQSPAGSGKTQMGIAMIAETGVKALWVTHTKDLLKQSKERAERYLDPKLMGTITEGKVNIGEGITFATVQTLTKLDLSLYKNTWDMIIVDECHRVAGTPTKITQFSHVLNSLAAPHKYGLSATVHRSDGLIRATYALLGKVVYTVPKEAVADRVMRVGIMPCHTKMPISLECQNTDGTVNYSGLINYLAYSYPRDLVILDKLVRNAEHSCLILSDRLEHLKHLMEMLPYALQQKAVMISGDMTTVFAKRQRDAAIELMRSGDKHYLFATYSLAKEGLDIPCLDRLFLTTPHHDYAVITQSIGRIARTHEGKGDPIVYDFIDDIPFCENTYRKRKTTYRKNGCYFLEESP